MKEFLENMSLSLLKNNKRIILVIALSVFLGLITIVMGSEAIACYRSAMKISDENLAMKKTIDDWREAVAFIDKQKYRPVEKDSVPSVTSDILMELQSYNLKLTDFKDVSGAVQGKKDTNYRVFMLKFSGDYANTVRFFSNFHARDALLNIRQLKMVPKDKEIETEMFYRIYMK